MHKSNYSSQQIDEALTRLLSGEAVEDESSPTIAEKYSVQQVLAWEGQATVVQAIDTRLRRRVVLKIYHDSLTENQKIRIVNEGRALAQIRSPHVVQCLGVEEFEGTMFLVLEYVEANSLTEFLAKEKPDADELRELFRQLVGGVEASHACGVLHLDLKPSNVLITPDGKVKLIDFGLVQSVTADNTSVGSGTPAFMPPEIARKGENVDERTDVFGLGAVLYYMLNGKPPFQSETIEQQRELAKRCEVTRITESNDRRLPSDLIEICHRCMRPEPQQRFSSVADIKKSLPQSEGRPQSPNFTWAALAGLLLTALLIVAIGVIRFGWFSTKDTPAPKNVAAEKEKAPSAHPASNRTPSRCGGIGESDEEISPRGQVADERRKSRISVESEPERFGDRPNSGPRRPIRK